MKNNPKYYNMEEFIVRYLNKGLSETEKQKVDSWLKDAAENMQLFEDYKKLWDSSNKLSSIEKIDVDTDWQKTKHRIHFENKESHSIPLRKNRFHIWRAAAAIIILLGIGLLSKQYLLSTSEMIRIETAELKQEITLPDGSMVFLNKNSELLYPKKFSRKIRLVSLSGEGYFNVAKNPNKKFRINIDEQAVVEVLGTSFNINSEKENELVDINVVSGKVAFYKIEDEATKTILAKNDNALLQNGSISKNLPKDKNFMSWRTGVIYFENESIENVCTTLSQFYDRQITTEGLEDKEILFTSTIDNQKLESVLEEIKLVLNLDYKTTDNKIIIYTLSSDTK